MKIASFGFEADAMKGNTATVLWPVKNPIVIRAYQFSLALMVTVRPGLLAAGDYCEVLFTAAFSRQAAADLDFGPVQMPKTAHGFDLENSMFCRAILKTWVSDPPIANAVNDVITLTGLNLPVSAGEELVMFAGHAGYGPADFECQGAIFYETSDYLTGS